MVNIFLTQYNGAILGPIAKVMGFILDKLFLFLNVMGIQNIGITIILFTFIMKLLMTPMTIKQQKFAKVSQKMNPEIKSIQDKYKDKKDQASQLSMQQELREVYKKYGTSPTGGCLQIIIQFPIILALYRVVQNIPAYVNNIKVLYINIVNNIVGVEGYRSIIETYAKAKRMNVDKIDLGSQDSIIDVLSKFNSADWIDFKEKFGVVGDSINANIDQLNKMNTFFGGLNMTDAPGIMWPGILIPVFAFIFAYLANKTLQTNSPTNQNSNDPTAQSMKMMTNFFPVMSAVICITMPSGLGLYWIASSAFQYVQQIVINKFLNKDDEEIQINSTQSIVKDNKVNNSGKSNNKRK